MLSPRVEKALESLKALQGLEVRHDLCGFYICTVAEGEYEDDGHNSVGFDGRLHFVTITGAIEFAKRFDSCGKD